MKILIIDDHTLFRKALTQLICGFAINAEVIEAENGVMALEIIEKATIDVALLDVEMPIMGGVETLKRVSKLMKVPRVIVLTQYDEISLRNHMMSLGASNYLLKKCSPTDLKEKILDAYFSEQGDNKSKNKNDEFSNTKTGQNIHNVVLAHRQTQLINLIKDGKSNKEISIFLNLSLNTVESYRKALMKKTKCRNTAEIVSLAIRLGMRLNRTQKD